MIIKKQYLLALLLFFVSWTVWGNEVTGLRQAIDSKAPRKTIIDLCKKASLTGDVKLVAVVEPLLTDPDLSHPARFVLERLSAPDAGKALRNALTKTKDPLLLSGILGSLGKRSEAENVSAIAPFLLHENDDVVRTAAFALGKQGTGAAADLLLNYWQKGNARQKKSAASGLLESANLLVRNKNNNKAKELLNAVWNAKDLPAYWRASAAGLLLNLEKQENSSSENALLQAIALEKDPQIVQVLLPYGRSLKDRSALNSLLISKYDILAEKVKPSILVFLSETSEAKAGEFLLEKGLSDDPLALDALNALGKTGNVATAETLFETLEKIAKNNKSVTPEKIDAAFGALALMKDPKIDSLVKRKMEESFDLYPVQLLVLAGKRKISADSIYHKALGYSDHKVIAAAAFALGETGNREAIDLLVRSFQNCNDPKTVETIKSAIRTISLRQTDKEMTAARLVTNLKILRGQNRIDILDLLGELGGSKALTVLVEYVMDSDPDLQDNAVRILSSWKDQIAAPYLLQIAQRHPNGKFRNRALKGYVRLVRESNDPDAVRLQRCEEAMKVASRLDEKKIVVMAYGRIFSEDSLQKLAFFFDNPDLKEKAFEAATDILERLPKNRSVKTGEMLQKIYKETKNDLVKARLAKLR